LAVRRSSELSEEVDEFVVRRWRLQQTAATALEARPDFTRRLHRAPLPRPVAYLHHRSQLTGQDYHYRQEARNANLSVLFLLFLFTVHGPIFCFFRPAGVTPDLDEVCSVFIRGREALSNG